jgi:radical SAM protein with 4Fe4S-binding SPASM domain
MDIGAAENYYRYILDLNQPLPRPKIVIFELTHRCNLRCGHCYNDGPDPSRQLTTGEVTSILKGIPSPGTTALGFTGGEVMVRADVMEILEAAHKMGFENINIDSNGTLIDEDTIGRFKELGVKSLHVSLDGPEEINDQLRGNGSYRKVVKAIKLAVTAGITVTLNMTVGQLNAGYIQSLFNRVKPLEIHYFKVEPLLIKSKARHLQELLLEKSDILRVCDTIKVLQDSSPPTLVIDNLFKTYMEEKPLLGCPSGKSFCMISREGRMFHCPVFTEHASPKDSLLGQDFAEVWGKSDFLNALRDPGTFKTACHNCKYLEICAGGCHARAFIATGSFFERDPLCPFSI